MGNTIKKKIMTNECNMNKNPEEHKIVLERIASLVGDYRFKT